MFGIEFVVIILMLLLGARYGGLFFGMAGALGLAILVVVFGCPPTSPPISVLLIIMAVVLAASTLQQCGGMDYLVKKGEKLLRKHPNQVIFIAPLLAWIFTFMAGTGNVLFNILPVIAEVSRQAGVRPERPISISVIASQHAVVASPISAATVALAAILAPSNISLLDILMLTIPSTLIGCLAGAFSVLKYGKDLDKDEEYLEKLSKDLIDSKDKNAVKDLSERKGAKVSVAIFLGAALLVVVLGTFPGLMPVVTDAAGKVVKLSMNSMMEIIMMSSAALMVIVCKPDVDNIHNTNVFKAGMMGVVTIFGLAWMADSFVQQNIFTIKAITTTISSEIPALFAVVVFVASIFLDSQGATVAALMPLGLTMGIEPMMLAAIFPAVCGYYVIPNNGVMLAGVAFDNSGTTKIGKLAINHSYMLPGTVATLVATLTGVVLYKVFF